MVTRVVEKVVAAQLLESVKEAGNHLSRLRIEAVGASSSKNSMPGAKAMGSEAVMGLYTRVRRIRDHLRRCVGAYPAQVEIDFAPEDADLLVSCVLFRLEGLQAKIVSPKTRRTDRPWLQESANSLAEEAIALATKRASLLPNPFGSSPPTGIAVETIRRINQVCEYSTHADMAREEQAKKVPSSAPKHVRGFGGSDLEESAIPKVSLEPMIPGVLSRQESADKPDAAAKPVEAPAPQAPAAVPARAAGRRKVVEQSPQSSVDKPASELGDPDQTESSTWTMFLDPRHIRDPRLRGVMLLDLRALVRAVAAQDYRLAAVHLSSVLEGALIDHAIPLADEFELTGTPDTWVLSNIVARVYDGDFPARKRSLFSQLIASRKLIQPAQQMQMPMVMTSSIFGELGTFVSELLARIGMVGNTRSIAPVAGLPKRPVR